MNPIVHDVQKFLMTRGISPGPHDGIWGSKTSAALQIWRADQLAQLRKHSPFPRDEDTPLREFYGHPTHTELTPVKLPEGMTFWLYDDVGKNPTNHRMNFHPACVEAFEDFYARVWEFYGKDQKRLDASRFSRFFGSHVDKRRGSNGRWSTHAYGAATDHDANQNGLYTARQHALMPEEILEIAVHCNLKPLGVSWGQDFMHFEATRP